MDDNPEQEPIFSRTRYSRSGDGLEFDRVANFADAIYAISLTLIVVGIAVPQLGEGSSDSELLRKLNDLLPNIITFFVVFFVVGNYWFAHHQFMSWLGAVDSRLIHIQLVYLSVIAFLPFPAALLGTLDSNPYALAIFALAMAAASLLETIMIGRAHKAGLMRQKLSDTAYKWERNASFSAVVVFVLSIPIGFISVWLGIAFWFMNAPIGLVLDRNRPLEFGGTSRQSRR